MTSIFTFLSAVIDRWLQAGSYVEIAHGLNKGACFEKKKQVTKPLYFDRASLQQKNLLAGYVIKVTLIIKMADKVSYY